MRKITLVIFIFFRTVLSYGATPDSLIFKIKPLHKGVTETHKENGYSVTYTKRRLGDNTYLFYKNNINSLYTRKNFKDSAWSVLSCDDTYDFEANDDFTGQATFRLHYKFTDSTLNTPLVCELSQAGASEIYIDGTLVKKYGKIGSSETDEEIEIPMFDPLYIQQSDTLEHVLTILYSNFTGLERTKKLDELGIEVKFFFFDDYHKDSEETNLYHKFLIGLFAFFFALAIAHFLLYFSDRSKRFNLFYALFLLMIALTSIRSVLTVYIGSPGLLEFINYIDSFFIPCCMFFLLNLIYSLFKIKPNGFFYVQVAFLACFIIGEVFGVELLSAIAFASLFFGTYGGVTFIAIKALRRKYNGANYLGWGILLFTILFIFGVLATSFSNNSLWLFVFFAGAILALPISMTAYLSHDFATTSKSLKAQLEANEELSRKGIEQEKEKQELLANQNKVLEIQVEERTKEIASQNQVLEEQKKEITDSINYAKRIQQSMLPPLEEIFASLPDAFVLFMPKDIVSGDFYWFHRSEERILIAAADCTGHGVPGAIMSMLGTEKLNEASAKSNDVSTILSLVNKGVKKSLRQSESENSTRDGMDIALCSFNTKMNELYYAGANRPIWIIRGSTSLTTNSQPVIEEIKATKTAIGGTTDDAHVFEKHQIKLQKGDTIYIFSDGYADQFSPEDKKLMTRKFKEIILSIQNLSAAEQRDHLDDFMIKWKGNMEQTDDILVIGVKV